jgi:hypothetical protein
VGAIDDRLKTGLDEELDHFDDALDSRPAGRPEQIPESVQPS